MSTSAQPYINHLTSRRRFLESMSPSTRKRIFIKRSTTPEEAAKPLSWMGTPAERTERSFSSLQNEALAIGYIKDNTDIPVPDVLAIFEDRGCLYLIQEYVENAIPATDTPVKLHPHITRQLERYMSQLHNIRSKTLHSFTDEVHFPARLVSTKAFLSHLRYPEDPRSRYVLCHGDLGWQNVMVDPKTGDIKAIIDWEYAGFYPVEVEGQYWKRWGTASRRDLELPDTDALSSLLYNLSTTKDFPPGYTLLPQVDYVKESTLYIPRRKKRQPSLTMFKSLYGLRRKPAASSPHIDSQAQTELSPLDSAGAVKKSNSPLGPNARFSSPVEGISTKPVEGALESSPPFTSPAIATVDPVPPEEAISGREIEACDAPEWADLAVSHPEDLAVSARSLALEVAVASRESLVKQLASLKRGAEIDHRAMQDWVWSVSHEAPAYFLETRKNNSLAQETIALVALHRLVSGLVQQLHLDLLKSIEPLKQFQQQDAVAQGYVDKIKNRTPDTIPRDKNGNTVAPGSDPLVWEASDVWRRVHSGRDQAFRESETLKWAAIKQCATKLSVLSHAAETLLPFTPDRVRNQPSRHVDPARKIAEDRVRDLFLGGTGGWEAAVVDVKDWVPLDPEEHGVPEETIQEHDIGLAPDRLVQAWYQEDADFLAGVKPKVEEWAPAPRVEMKGLSEEK